MANIVKYKNQVWGEPIDGERLSTNGYYTGHHNGTVMQDASVAGTEQPYEVERNTIRYGTMMGDAASGSMPDIGVGVKQILTGCTSNKEDDIYKKGAEFKATYSATSGYTLPSTVVVKVGGVTKTVTTDYTFASGVLTIPAAKVTGDIEVTVTATKS